MRISTLALATAVVACLLIALAITAAGAPRDHPDRVTHLPGLSFKPSFAHYSGYITLPESPSRMHYWFVESQNDPATDPVVLWLNGGPGCSSMLGMLTENGPFAIQQDGATIALNPYAWNRFASIVYLESPPGVGFSYGTNNNYTSGDTSTAQDNYNFLLGFFAEYSEFATQRFYIAGESYAGNYILELAQLIAHGENAINLQGISAGNPTMNWKASANLYLPFVAEHGLISAADFTAVNKLCGGQFSPPASPECGTMVNALLENVIGINPYNLYDMCRGQGYGDNAGCFTLDAVSAAHKPTLPFGVDPDRFFASSRVGAPMGQTFVPCIDLTPITTYLNNPEVMAALHIPAEEVVLPWNSCSQVLNYNQYESDMVPIYEDLLANTSIRILVYSGDVDSCVPYLGTEATVVNFPYAQRTPLKDAWQSWHYTSAAVPNVVQIGGKFMQWAERLAYATVRGAGHMVPHDRPEAALSLFYSFMNDPTQLNLKRSAVVPSTKKSPERTSSPSLAEE